MDKNTMELLVDKTSAPGLVAMTLVQQLIIELKRSNTLSGKSLDRIIEYSLSAYPEQHGSLLEQQNSPHDLMTQFAEQLKKLK